MYSSIQDFLLILVLYLRKSLKVNLISARKPLMTKVRNKLKVPLSLNTKYDDFMVTMKKISIPQQRDSLNDTAESYSSKITAAGTLTIERS